MSRPLVSCSFRANNPTLELDVPVVLRIASCDLVLDSMIQRISCRRLAFLFVRLFLRPQELARDECVFRTNNKLQWLTEFIFLSEKQSPLKPSHGQVTRDG